MKSLPWPALMLLSMGAAMWPVWRWYVARIGDGSDEPWGVLALITLATLASRQGRLSPAEEKHFVWPAALLAVYCTTFAIFPPLARALLAASALGALLFRSRGAAGLWGLLALSLPILATLQFYLGYPLRVLAAEASVITLRLCGFSVARKGSLLEWAGESIMVDAPCSGIQMLWFGLYLAFLLAAFFRLNAPRTLICAAGAGGVVVAANMMRATALFFKETRIVSLPEWTHAAIGIVIFAAAAWFVTILTRKLQPKPCTP